MAKKHIKQSAVPAHLRHTTKFTREGVMDYNNYKPYRTKRQKVAARASAVKTDGGTYRSSAPVSRHPWSDAMSKGTPAS